MVTAASLEAGVEYVETALGVQLQNGGQHLRMGTHNKLLKLGEDLYLEVISIDPGMNPPDRARWFALDCLANDSQPSLATWVVQTKNIEYAVASSPIDHGVIEPMSRGDLRWLITITSDGELVLDGTAPGLIQWQDAHPANAMEESGCRLKCLEVYSPHVGQLNAFLEKQKFKGQLLVHGLPAEERGYIQAQIETPQGLRLLGDK